MRTPLMNLAFLTVMVALSSCGKKADTAASTTTTTTTSAIETPATSVASGLPADCDAYFAKVESCANKMGSAGGQYKQVMEMSRAQWAKMPNKEMVGPMCKQALTAFAQQASVMGCPG